MSKAHSWTKTTLLPTLFLAVMLSGCAHITGASGETAVEKISDPETARALIPAGWQTDVDDAFPTQIDWAYFDDPILLGLVKNGLENNLSLESALLSLQSAQISLEQVETALVPRLNLGSANAGLSQSRTGSVNESYSLGGTASYQIDLWGRIGNDVARAALSFEDRETALKITRISIAQRITQTYFDLRVQDEFIRLQGEQIDIQREQLRLTQVRLSAGVIPRLNVDQIDVNIQSLLSNLETQRANRTNLERTLATLLGRAPQDFTLEPMPFVFMDIPRLRPDAPAAVLLQRPDIERGERRISTSDISLDGARKAWLPTLGLSASTSQRGLSIGDFLTADGIAASIGASLSVLLYDNGNRGRAVSQSLLSREQAVNSYSQTILSALQDVEQVLTQQAQNIRQIEIQKLQQAAQERVTRITQARYDTGAASAFDLVTEQRNALNSRRQRISNWQTGMRTSIRMLVSLGIEPELF